MTQVKTQNPTWIEEEEFPVQYLYTKFVEVAYKYTHDMPTTIQMFEEIHKLYSGRGRHYHNCIHIYRMCRMWSRFKDKLKNPDMVFFAIMYHDIIYKPRKSDNEIQSALFFEKIANEHLDVTEQFIDEVKCAIIATEHKPESIAFWGNNTDIQYLLDFDLEILGETSEIAYDWYRKGVRKEYRIYPNILYKPGRKKVLESFLSREKIYLTPEFEPREKNARNNLQKEINSYLC
jgi:predicted metal-dependent HD superfamily phosphohydrolase